MERTIEPAHCTEKGDGIPAIFVEPRGSCGGHPAGVGASRRAGGAEVAVGRVHLEAVEAEAGGGRDPTGGSAARKEASAAAGDGVAAGRGRHRCSLVGWIRLSSKRGDGGAR